jgi:hypothetical protein
MLGFNQKQSLGTRWRNKVKDFQAKLSTKYEITFFKLWISNSWVPGDQENNNNKVCSTIFLISMFLFSDYSVGMGAELSLAKLLSGGDVSEGLGRANWKEFAGQNNKNRGCMGNNSWFWQMDPLSTQQSLISAQCEEATPSLG